jgi:hypothetical protein
MHRISNHQNRLPGTVARRHDAGFSLLELLVVVGLIIILASLGVSAFKGGNASDGTRGASEMVASLFDSARNEAIVRRVPVRVIFDLGGAASPIDTAYRRVRVAYSTNGGTNWVPSGPWTKFPGSAHYDACPLTPMEREAQHLTNAVYSRPTGTNMILDGSSFGASSEGAVGFYYEYLPNGQISQQTQDGFQPPKVVFSPGAVANGIFRERPDRKSLYGFVIGKLGRTQQFADLESLKTCP